jgi:hypothetical protein
LSHVSSEGGVLWCCGVVMLSPSRVINEGVMWWVAPVSCRILIVVPDCK